MLRFHVNNTSTSPVHVPPTPYWVQQIEVSIGTQQIEVLYPNDIFNETVGFKNKDELDATNEVLKCNTGYVTIDSTLAPGLSFAYLPFNCALTSARLNVAGLEEDIVFRVYFPPNIFPSSIKLSSAVLVVEEDVGNQKDKQDNKDAHKSGIYYNVVVRQRQQTTMTKASDSAEMTLDLTGLNGASAGLVVYAAPAVVPGTGATTDPYDGATAVSVNELLNKRYDINTLELNDQMGAKRTEELRGEALIAFTWFNHVGTSFPARPKASTYLIPFASSFRRAVEEGNNYGHLAMDGTDRLALKANFANPSSTSETWVVNVTNYVYQVLFVKNGKLASVFRK